MDKSYSPSLNARINSFVNGLKESNIIIVLSSNEEFDLCNYLEGQLIVFYKLVGNLSIEDNINALTVISDKMIVWINELNSTREPNYKRKIEGIWKFDDYLTLKKKEVSNSMDASTVGNKKMEKQIAIIFKNKYAYQMFLRLEELTIKGKSKSTETADYAFIFHKMKNAKCDYINDDIKHRVFMDFLNDYHGTKITDDKFPKRNPTNKQAIYSTVLKEFQPKIESEP